MADRTPKSGKIGAHIGITKNLGNYESLRLETHAEADVQDIHDPAAWEELWSEIEERLESKIEEANEDLS